MPARRKGGEPTDKQHGKVDMLKAARSTVAEPVMRNIWAPEEQGSRARKKDRKR